MMVFTAFSTIFLYTDPVNTAGVIRGVSIGERFELLEIIGHGGTTAIETWVKVKGGWLLVWNGGWYGKLDGV